MKKLILVCGPAAIGKSTYSKKYAEEHPDEKVVIISADETRKDMFGDYTKFPPNGNMMVVYDEMIRRTHELTKANQDVTVIYDTTMLYDERRLFFRRHLQEFDYVELVLLKLHDYHTCLIRNKQRIPEKWVPDEIILSMAASYKDPTEETKAHFDETKIIYVD